MDFNTFLKSRRCTTVKNPKFADNSFLKFSPVVEDFVLDNEEEEEPSELIIPPLNTNVQFADFLPPYKKKFSGFSSSNELSATPKNFSWTISSSADSTGILEKKLHIGPVMDQQGCGSCWAFAVSSAMSDCLVVSGVVNWSPYISPTFCMASYPQGRCNGGFPAKLATDIEKYGASDQSCVDYSWCDNDSLCNIRDSSNHFDVDSKELSRMIPDRGCLYSADKYIYYIDKGTSTYSITTGTSIETYRNMVREHIFEFGPLIGGYAVMNNFLDGKFTQYNEGLYFDRADYANMKSDGTISFSDSVRSSANCAGCHAVSVVGWGVAENVHYDNNKNGDVPFWYCRNSWGTKWGDNGFFKIAMYPFNKIAQFDKIVTFPYKGENIKIGGLVLIRATTPPVIKTLKEINENYKNDIILTEPIEFYKKGAESGKGIKKVPTDVEFINPSNCVIL